MAGLVKQGSHWYVKYYPVKNGKAKWVKGYTDKAKTRELAAKLENEKVAIQRGDLDPQHEQRKVERAKAVTGHVSAYRTALVARGCSSNHVSYTVRDIEAAFTHAGVTHATAYTRAHAEAWVGALLAASVDSRNTINRRVGSLQAFLRYLREAGGVTEYVLNKFPKLKTKGHEKRKRRSLTRAEADALLDKAPADRRTIYRFALLTGFRYAEIASLTPASFNLGAMTVTVQASDAKNKRRDQTIPLAAALLDEVKSSCAGKAREDRVFAMPPRTDAAKLLREDCKAAGVDTTHVDFHCLRHTFITRLAEAMVHPKVLQELARHASIDTTLRYYTHFRQADERNAINGLTAVPQAIAPTRKSGRSQRVRPVSSADPQPSAPRRRGASASPALTLGPAAGTARR